jgi:hypothetical protein
MSDTKFGAKGEAHSAQILIAARKQGAPVEDCVRLALIALATAPKVCTPT